MDFAGQKSFEAAEAIETASVSVKKESSSTSQLTSGDHQKKFDDWNTIQVAKEACGKATRRRSLFGRGAL